MRLRCDLTRCWSRHVNVQVDLHTACGRPLRTITLKVRDAQRDDDVTCNVVLPPAVASCRSTRAPCLITG
ncbi:hypothetical protein FCJ61_33440 [Burkholderia metallica]|nr:hypothetical protein [Burkholderia metallica]